MNKNNLIYLNNISTEEQIICSAPYCIDEDGDIRIAAEPEPQYSERFLRLMKNPVINHLYFKIVRGPVGYYVSKLLATLKGRFSRSRNLLSFPTQN